MSVESSEPRPALRDVSRPAEVDGAPGGAVDGLEPVLASVLQENAQLRHALQSRIVIEQAKGVLAERYALELEAAFEVLRMSARDHRMSIHKLARAVVESHETPPQIRAPQDSY